MSRRTEIIDDPTHLPTYREMESDTDENDHFLKDQMLLIDIDHVYAKVVEGIKSLDSENLCDGRSIISAMDQADAGKYLDDRIEKLIKEFDFQKITIEKTKTELENKNNRPMPSTLLPKYNDTIFLNQSDEEQTNILINIKSQYI